MFGFRPFSELQFEDVDKAHIFQKYEVEFLLQQQWYDPRLRYSNQSHYDFLNAIHHHEDIWLPDTYFIMHGDFKVSLPPIVLQCINVTSVIKFL